MIRQNSNNWPELLVGLGIAAAGVLIAQQAMGIRVAPMYAKVGPAAFMWLTSAMLILCGGVVAWKSRSVAADAHSEYGGPLIILAGLAAATALLEIAGFIIVATLLFATTAAGLGSRRYGRDLIIGLVTAVLAYFVFGKLLGLRLPLGSLFT